MRTTTQWLEHAIEQWLRNYATSQKVAGARLDGVNEFLDFT
jgi:hypothetical protein